MLLIDQIVDHAMREMHFEHAGILVLVVLIWRTIRKEIRDHVKWMQLRFNGHEITYKDKAVSKEEL